MRNFILFPETIHIHFPHGAYLRFPAMAAQNFPLRQKYYSKSSFLAQYPPAAMAIEYQEEHDCTNLTANNHRAKPIDNATARAKPAPCSRQMEYFGASIWQRHVWQNALDSATALAKTIKGKSAYTQRKKPLNAPSRRTKKIMASAMPLCLLGGLEIGAIFLVYEQPADRHNACKQNSSHRPHNPSRLPGIC